MTTCPVLLGLSHSAIVEGRLLSRVPSGLVINRLLRAMRTAVWLVQPGQPACMSCCVPYCAPLNGDQGVVAGTSGDSARGVVQTRAPVSWVIS